MRISTEDIRDEDWLKVAKSLFSSVSPHIGYGRPHTCAKPTTLSLRCPRTSVPAQRSPREVCATAAPDQRYGDPVAWFVSGARREVQPVAGISVVHPAWRRGGCTTDSSICTLPAAPSRSLHSRAHSLESARTYSLRVRDGKVVQRSAARHQVPASIWTKIGQLGMRDILKLLEFARIYTGIQAEREILSHLVS